MKHLKNCLALLFALVLLQFSVTAQQLHDEMLNAQVSVRYKCNTYSPSEKECTHAEKVDATIKGNLVCNVMTFRIKSFVNNQNRLANCSSATHCPIVAGTSKYDEYNDKAQVVKEIHNLLDVSKSVTTLDDYSGKLITTRTYSASGTNDMDVLNLEIKPYNAPQGQLQPLTPQYVIWLTGGLGLDFKNPARKPVGDGTGQHWEYEKEMMVPDAGPFEIIIPADINEADHSTESGEVYDQLLITNYREFENYLLNPKGEFKIKASGNRNVNYNGTEEKNGFVEVEISLTPYVELNKLTK